MSGILVRLFERSAPIPEQRSTAWLDAVLNAQRTASGVPVTPDRALTYSAVWACVKVLAESVASLPLILYRRLPNGGKERATDHPLYAILHDAPNPEMTSADWREAMMVNLTLWGNAYGQIITDRGNRVREIWPMLSRYIEVKRTSVGELLYVYSENGAAKKELRAAEVLHVRSMSMNGVEGLSPIAQARQAVGLGLATETYGAAFFGNGANPGIILEHPGTLSPDAYDRLKMDWEARAGADNAHKTVILEEGMKIEKIGVPPDDAQFLETRKFQVNEITRWYRIPPHMIGDLEKATFSNIEHQALDFVVHSLRPWLVRWEQAISRALLKPKERGTLFAEFLVDGMLRGDITSRYTAYSTARLGGWFSVNDIRAMENMNPVEGGDTYMAPLNMVELAKFGQEDLTAENAAQSTGLEGAEDKKEEEQPQRAQRGEGIEIGKALTGVYRDATVRIMRRMQRDVSIAARKYLSKGDADGFYRWLDGFGVEMREFASGVLLPGCVAHGKLRGKVILPEDVAGMAARYVEGEVLLARDTAHAAGQAGVDAVESLERVGRKYASEQVIDEVARRFAAVIGGDYE